MKNYTWMFCDENTTKWNALQLIKCILCTRAFLDFLKIAKIYII